ncbi:hypothetical protein [Methylocystis parvus]|uniref:hypothetical protein n=1 Tax=Methylocystis parvus TaxID=134 RepID=UPI0002ECF7A4|nr:hypothetical protein [Methylocystis parvus]WBK01231.1 hypothetical protein MMG94_05830 [Methylocystis parvus OBBP]
MLNRVILFSKWSSDEQPDIMKMHLWLEIVRELMSLTALTPEEERLVKRVLEVQEAIAIMETNNDRA